MDQITTVPVLITESGQFEPESIGHKRIIDYAFKNIGSTDVLLWGMFPLNAGDGLISFSGYKDKIRKDSISIEFTSGTGKLICFITKYVC